MQRQLDAESNLEYVLSKAFSVKSQYFGVILSGKSRDDYIRWRTTHWVLHWYACASVQFACTFVCVESSMDDLTRLEREHRDREERAIQEVRDLQLHSEQVGSAKNLAVKKLQELRSKQIAQLDALEQLVRFFVATSVACKMFGLILREVLQDFREGMELFSEPSAKNSSTHSTGHDESIDLISTASVVEPRFLDAPGTDGEFSIALFEQRLLQLGSVTMLGPGINPEMGSEEVSSTRTLIGSCHQEFLLQEGLCLKAKKNASTTKLEVIFPTQEH